VTVWTFALLARLAQVAQTLFGVDRPAFFRVVNEIARNSEDDMVRKREVPVFVPHRNDLSDAAIGASAATCGILITEDEQLGLRVNFLHAGDLVRTQAFRVDDLYLRWKAPPPATDGGGR